LRDANTVSVVEAALKNRYKQFVIDGEAVILGVDGVSDFNALHSGKHNDQVRLYAFIESK
jgi:bifunctional non-homologous end joining protein LigD